LAHDIPQNAVVIHGLSARSRIWCITRARSCA